MKTITTPTLNVTVNYNPTLLKDNGIYLAGTDNEKIYVDDLFQKMPSYVRKYILLHEEGHIVNQHPYKRILSQEVEADEYAIKNMGKRRVYRAMYHIMKVFSNIDWTIAAEYVVRLADLGLPRGNEMFIIAPNGLRFDVPTLRNYL